MFPQKVLAPLIFTFVTYFLTIPVKQVSAGTPCPQNLQSIDAACTCYEIMESKVKRFTQVVCTGIEKDDQLTALTKELAYMTIDKMVISKSVYSKIVPEHTDEYYTYYPEKITKIFDHWKLEVVQIREIVFQDFDVDPDNRDTTMCIWEFTSFAWSGFFDTLTSISAVNISQNQLSDDCIEKLVKFPNLQNLRVSHNNISYVPLFPELTQLKTLDFSSNHLSSLQPGTFSNLPSLLRINLSHNELIEVYRSIFPLKLTEIDLSWNLISYLPDDFLFNMDALKKLDLNHNVIQVIDFSRTFRAYPSISFIDLQDNFLVCNCTMEWASKTNVTLLTEHKLEVKGRCRNPKSLEFRDVRDASIYKDCK